jgi:hypothetical protein
VAVVASPRPSASPDPEAIRKAAASAYLAAAETANSAYKALDKKYPHLTTLARVHAYNKASAKIEGTFILAIKRLVVPADTVGDLHSLVAKATSVQALDLEAAVTRTYADALRLEPSQIAAGRAYTASANLVRSDLNLPPVHF